MTTDVLGELLLCIIFFLIQVAQRRPLVTFPSNGSERSWKGTPDCLLKCIAEPGTTHICSICIKGNEERMVPGSCTNFNPLLGHQFTNKALSLLDKRMAYSFTATAAMPQSACHINQQTYTAYGDSKKL